MKRRIITYTIALLVMSSSGTKAAPNAPLFVAGTIVTSIGAFGSIAGGITWGVKACEEYCDSNSTFNHMVTKTTSYACTRCNTVPRSCYSYVNQAYYDCSTSYCYPSTCTSSTRYCSDNADHLQDPLTRQEEGYDTAMYTTIGFLVTFGVGLGLIGVSHI